MQFFLFKDFKQSQYSAHSPIKYFQQVFGFEKCSTLLSMKSSLISTNQNDVIFFIETSKWIFGWLQYRFWKRCFIYLYGIFISWSKNDFDSFQPPTMMQSALPFQLKIIYFSNEFKFCAHHMLGLTKKTRFLKFNRVY